MRHAPLLLCLVACGRNDFEMGGFTVVLNDDGGIDVTHPSGATATDLHLVGGAGEVTVESSLGAFKFTEVSEDLRSSGSFGHVDGGRNGLPVVVSVGDAAGDALGTLVISAATDALFLDWTPDDPAGNRVGFDAACAGNDHFLGLGSHAFDVDHAGEAFALFVSEPGVGKSDQDAYPVDWYGTGTRHSTSFPVPFALRPEQPSGVLLDATGRVEADLCSGARFSLVGEQTGGTSVVIFAGADPVDVISGLTAYTGRPALPPAWVFSPWNDAIRGAARVDTVATELRDAGAPSSAIWTEDWKGAEQKAFGYHLTGEWTVDETLYPDAAGIAADLEGRGFKWLAYFSQFVFPGTAVWDDAVAQDVLIKHADGTTYTFLAPPIDTASLVDLSTSAGRDFVRSYLDGALDVGFDGWMADYGEWLPMDAVLASGEDAAEVHNLYPQWWQQVNADAVADRDATFFVRSGWTRSGGLVPVVWGGDQRTDFAPDDGFPTVLPLGLGLAASGVPVFTHDVGGYQSLGNPPSTKELWYRWAELAAFSPIARTHHGAFDSDNWQFDTDAETTAFWAAQMQEHMRIFPYRYGLAARAASDGIPMVMPVAFRYGDDWGRMDAWLLGDALLVAPVTTAGATGRDVTLPPGVQWYDWWTRAPVSSGHFDADLEHIPVFAAAGTTVPTFAEIPDTLVEGADPAWKTLADVDGARVVYLFGGGGPFTEADGTAYAVAGKATQNEEKTATLTSGDVQVGGVTVTITGTTERAYTLVVIP